MTVSKTKNGNVMTYIGTSNEVAQALSDDQVPLGKLMAITYNGTNITAFVKIL